MLDALAASLPCTRSRQLLAHPSQGVLRCCVSVPRATQRYRCPRACEAPLPFQQGAEVFSRAMSKSRRPWTRRPTEGAEGSPSGPPWGVISETPRAS